MGWVGGKGGLVDVMVVASSTSKGELGSPFVQAARLHFSRADLNPRLHDKDSIHPPALAPYHIARLSSRLPSLVLVMSFVSGASARQV